jgi:hypothetical protein
MGKGLDTIIRKLWLEEESMTYNSRKVTPTQYFRSHHMEKGKRKKEILSTIQQKKEAHIRSESTSNP